MPRPLSTAALRAMLAQQTGEAFLVFLRIDHADLDEPIRVVSDGVDHVVDGLTWTAFPFEIAIPSESEDSVPSVKLSIDNVDRSIVQAVRSLASPPTVTIHVALGSSPSTIEAGPYEFTLRNVAYDALAVTGDLRFEDVLNEPCPGDVMSPTTFPGLF